MATRIGVDIGGTFTDLIYFDDMTGEVRVSKAPTTPGAPEIGCAAAIAAAEIGPALDRTRYFLHGTTVGLNALLERRGAVVGLLCTGGFRDILEFRRGTRRDFNLKWVPPEPLVPRRLRLGVAERIDARGQIVLPLEPADVTAALEIFAREGVTAVAVALLNAYANGAHELMIERLLREGGFDGAISLSHRISGEYREYERTSTTVIDAFVRARLSTYLTRLEGGLRGDGFGGTCLITRSGGGSMTFAEAEARPFETIMSGPVAGAEGSAELARRLDLGPLVTADVGGTSFDTTVIEGGRPQVLYEGHIADMPLQTQWVDVRSIGAGGGSLARIDKGGLLRVGPESAGAQPGPACYGRGGTEPTVTDAAFYLGMLGEGRLASGLMLDAGKAEAALATLAAPLGYTVRKVALGIIAIAASNMGNAIRGITIERGLDPRRMSLLAFGGAGPLMATELARALGIRRVIVPPHAGNFSAWGLLGADLVRAASRTRVVPVSEAGLRASDDLLAELFAEIEARAGGDGGQSQRLVALDLRYKGQEHTRTIEPPCDVDGRISASPAAVLALFETEYRKSFGTTLSGPVEIQSHRAILRQSLPRRIEAAPKHRAVQGGTTVRRPAWSFASGESTDCVILERDTLTPEAVHHGPAIVLEPTTTTYVDADFRFFVDPAGCLILEQTP